MNPPSETAQRPRVVVIGAGFAGLEVVRGLAHAPVDVLLLDQNNYTTFWPLMYQVATSGLEAQVITQPIRSILRRMPNVHFRLTAVQRVDLDRQIVITDTGEIPYDEVVIAAGSTDNFFGLEELEAHAFGFKELPEALPVRNHVIGCYDRALIETDPERVQALLTFVVVGGGPTGVELAGALAELNRHVMSRDYPGLDASKVRVLLVEMADRVLLTFPPKLSGKALRDLKRLGVDVRLHTSVAGYSDAVLGFKDGSTIATETVVWAAGIQGATLGPTLGVPLQRGSRVPINARLHLPDRPNVWVIGDMAYLEGPDGKPYPQLATVAMQQGRHVARNILSKVRGQQLRDFRYVDKGMMATVGRRRAVARIWGLNWDGPIAWWLWLVVHLLYLVGIRNRVLAVINWTYSYLTYDRAARAVFVAAHQAHHDLEPVGTTVSVVREPAA